MPYIFLGSDDFALKVLSELCERQPPALIVTRPDRPSGRAMRVKPGPIAAFASERGIAIFQPQSLRDGDAQKRLLDTGAYRMILVSFGQMVPAQFLKRAPPILNAHPSLLPRHRGPSPIQSAILCGDSETGVSIMRLVAEMDAGPVVCAKRIAIGEDDDAGGLREKLAAIAVELLLPLLSCAEIPAGTAQDSSAATFCRKLGKEDERMRPELASATEFGRLVRALSPSPGAYLNIHGQVRPVRLKILKARPTDKGAAPGLFIVESRRLFLGCKEGCLELLRVQMEGKTAVDAPVFLGGFRGPLALSGD